MKKFYYTFLSIIVLNAISFAGIKGIPGTEFSKSVYLGQAGFVENKGQILDEFGRQNSKVKFLYNYKDVNVQLHVNGFSYDTYIDEEIIPRIQDNISSDGIESSNTIRKYHRIDVEMLGANLNPEIVLSEPSVDYENYYNVQGSNQGILFVHTYKKVTYKDIYDGINLEFFINPSGKPEYNFIIKPGGDISTIKMKYKNANPELINGKLEFSLRHGKMEESIPASWSLVDGVKRSVEVNYKKLDQNVFGFVTNNVIPVNHTLIVDPSPNCLWATYYGSASNENSNDYAIDVATDSLGNIYMTGYTKSSTGIATGGTSDSTYGGSSSFDVMIVKFDANGVRLWGCYLGGSLDDFGRAITIDNQGVIYITGETRSTNGIAYSAVNGSHTAGNNLDAFVTKINDSGIIQWSNYFGGNSDDRSMCIAVNQNQEIFISGFTFSSTNIALNSTTTYSNSRDVYISKFSSSGNQLIGIYYGGVGDDRTRCIGIDNNGDVVIGGQTTTTDLQGGIATVNGHQIALGGGTDGFIAKFNSGLVLIWGSYYGGNTGDEIMCLAIDSLNNIYAGGYTNSATQIASPLLAMDDQLNNTDGFIVKFTPTCAREWGTYYGGNNVEYIWDMDLDDNENLYVAGVTTSNNFATAGAYQKTLGGGYDLFVSKIELIPNQTPELNFNTYFGGTGDEGTPASDEKQIAMTLDNNYNIVAVGGTESHASIATPGSHQSSWCGGTIDAFIAKFDNGCYVPETPDSIYGDNTPCRVVDTVYYSILPVDSATGYVWTYPANWTYISGQGNDSLAVLLGTNTGNITVRAYNGCDTSFAKTLSITNVYNLPNQPNWTQAIGTVNYGDSPILLTGGSPAGGVYSGPGFEGDTLKADSVCHYLFLHDATAVVSLMYTITNANLCSNSDTETFTLNCIFPGVIENGGVLDFNIYPNPASSEVTINLNAQQKATVRIVDILGNEILRDNINGSEAQIDISSLSEGIYFLELQTHERTNVRKFIKE